MKESGNSKLDHQGLDCTIVILHGKDVTGLNEGLRYENQAHRCIRMRKPQTLKNQLGMNHQQVITLRADARVLLRFFITAFCCAKRMLLLGWSARHAHRIADP